MKRLRFIIIFLISYAVISVASFLMAMSKGLGPRDAGDPPITFTQEILAKIGSIIVGILWFPMIAIHKMFFRGQSLPGNDWYWIIGNGFLYALVALFIYEKIVKGRQR